MTDDLEISAIRHLDVTSSITLIKKVAFGGHSDIWQGTMGDGILVAVKELRIGHRPSTLPRDERLKKHFNREINIWSKLHHPNVVPFLGYTTTTDGLPSLISPWYANGNIVDYLQLNPETKRPPLLLQVAQGLQYLHSLPLVHGDIKGDNVLVDSKGSASLCDFGMSKFIGEALHIPGFTTTAIGGTPRFLSPELLEDQPKTVASDVWAFGCVTIQILTDQIPYPHILSNNAVQIAIFQGDPPISPNFSPSINAEGLFWDNIRACWSSDPETRPSISEVVGYIQYSFPDCNSAAATADIIEPEAAPFLENFASLQLQDRAVVDEPSTPAEIQPTYNFPIPKELQPPPTEELSQILPYVSEQNPEKLYRCLKSVNSGYTGSIFMSKHLNGSVVAIKIASWANIPTRWSMGKHVSILRTSTHHNIMRYVESFFHKDRFWLVTEYLEGMTLRQSLEEFGCFDEPRIAFISKEILQGINYLHERGFILRNITAPNVMVTLDGDVKLTNFGYCISSTSRECSDVIGSWRCMAPEMVRNGRCSMKLDIWSLGVIGFEMLHGEPPLFHKRRDQALHMLMTIDELEIAVPLHKPLLRRYLTSTLAIDPQKRPDAKTLLQDPFFNVPNHQARKKLRLRGLPK